MRKIVIATVAGLALGLGFCIGGSARADTAIRCHSHYAYGSFQSGCTYGETHAEQAPAVDAAELERQDAKWLEFCQPTRAIDNEGVTRLRYAHKGCEFGRSE